MIKKCNVPVPVVTITHRSQIDQFSNKKRNKVKQSTESSGHANETSQTPNQLHSTHDTGASSQTESGTLPKSGLVHSHMNCLHENRTFP